MKITIGDFTLFVGNSQRCPGNDQRMLVDAFCLVTPEGDQHGLGVTVCSPFFKPSSSEKDVEAEQATDSTPDNSDD